MFGYCVWLQVSSTHNLNNIIKQFYTFFNTEKYIAHVTLDYNINKFIKDNYKVDDLIKDGEIYFTENNNFFSVQQDFFFKNNPSKLFHISLAYKVDKPFTEIEKKYLKSLKIDEEIKKKDLKINLWKCDSKYTKNWKLVKTVL
tara:strand:- start:76 stop:504 length:429 start_codon:yes stop_codon:yes gene_type:complete